MSERIVTARGEKFRQLSLFERAAELLGKPLARLPMRSRLRAGYHAMLLVATGGRGFQASLPGGELIRVLPRYRYMTWNVAEYWAFKRSLRPGAVALDVGANVGCYSVLLGQCLAPGGRVFAFEPAPEAFDGLVRHIRLNRLSAVVEPVQAALSDAGGVGRLVSGGATGTDRLAAAGEDRNGWFTPVRMTTIDEFCAQRGVRPDFIKVDVEGAELAVLRGARRTIAETRGTLALFVEMHPRTWAALGVSRDQVLAELDLQGLRAEPLGPAGDAWAAEGVCMRIVATERCAF